MAKKSSVQTNKNRLNLYKKYQEKRSKLKKNIMVKGDTEEQFKSRLDAIMKLSKLPRNSSKIRYRLRCHVTGRSRGNYRQFGICRIIFRELALQGHLPGITKSSW